VTTPLRERELVEWIRRRAPATGDDCAVLACEPWGQLLVTVDSVIDGVHAHWDEHGPAAFGYKAVARGLSDIAAMAGQPLWAVVAATLPPTASADDAKELFRGAERAGCELVGGDTAVGAVASVTATVIGRAGAGGPVLRSGARPGDRIVVSGPLGGSYASGHHVVFTPRVAEARALADACDVGAMIDISDGFAVDLHHVLAASGVGAVIHAEKLPLRSVPLAQALGDGEDYELLATVAPGAAGSALPAPFCEVGTVTDTPGAVLLHADGREETLLPQGFEHRA
jgi:thiamine-monophosphate kinase